MARTDRDVLDAELLRLQHELVTMQQWIRARGQRLVVVIEGRLGVVPYQEVPLPAITLPPVHHKKNQNHRRPPRTQTEVPDRAGSLLQP